VYDVIVAVAAEFLFDAHGFLLCDRAQLPRLRFEFALDQNLAGTRHALELANPELPAAFYS
jgi:hypothetical protein